jgi:predicted RNase H-like nuclease (RuvC/YqgF family)
MEPNDHDLLITLNTTVKSMAEKQDKFIDRYEVRHLDLSKRVAVLENQDGRDSERFRGLAEEIRRSLANAQKIELVGNDLNQLGVKVSNADIRLQELTDKVDEFRKKSNAMDAINAAGVTLSGIIGYIFGTK